MWSTKKTHTRCSSHKHVQSTTHNVNINCAWIKRYLWSIFCLSGLITNRSVLSRTDMSQPLHGDLLIVDCVCVLFVQGHPRLSTCVQTISLYLIDWYDFLLVINCNLSSTSLRFRDIAPRNWQKTPRSCSMSLLEEIRLNIVVKLTTQKVETLS